MEVPERPRPAMAQNERDRVGTLTRLVNEMDGNAIDRRLIVGERVHLLLMFAPIILITPIFDQFF